MKKIIIFLYFLIFSLIQIYTQVHLYGPEQAATFVIANSYSNLLNKQSLDAAYKSARFSVGQFLPSFNFSWSEDDTKKIGSTDTSVKSFSVNVSQLLYDGGKTKLTYTMNKVGAYYKIKEYEQSINELKLKAINQFNSCILLQKQIEIQENLEENAQLQLAIIEEEYKLGEALESDYLEYLISYKKIQDKKKQYQRDYNTQLLNFKLLLNIENETELVLYPTERMKDINTSYYLEPLTKNLWSIFKSVNPSLRKEKTELYYKEKEYDFSKKTYLPQVQFLGGVSFSGEDYPLYAPQYTAKIEVSFNNNPLIPIKYNVGAGFENDRITNLNHTTQTSIAVHPEYFINQSSLKIALEAKRQEVKDVEKSMFQSLYNKICAHDLNIDIQKRLEETLELQKKRLEISKQELTTGQIKRIDYLEALEDIAQTQIQIIELISSIESNVMELEIELGLDFGRLQNVCKEM